MSKLNLLCSLNAYSDEQTVNQPSLSNVKWVREIQGIEILEPESKSITLGAGQTISLFSGAVSISADATTTWNLALKSGSTSTYVLSRAAGTVPLFRTPRTSGAAADTSVNVTKNAKLLTFTSNAGTLFALIANGVIVGDEVKIGAAFNVANQGTYKILSRTATSFTVENENGVAETSIVLGANYATYINIYSAAGVQVGDKVEIIANFSSVSFGTYEITDISHDYIEFYCASSLPTESAVSNNPSAIAIYRVAKKFVYIESDKKVNCYINGSTTPNQIQPNVVNGINHVGMFMNSSCIKSLTLENTTVESASIFYITAE